MFVAPNTFKQAAYNAFVPVLIADHLFRTLLIASYLAVCLMISFIKVDGLFLVIYSLLCAGVYALTYVHLGIANHLRLYFDLQELELADEVKYCREAYRVVVGRVHALLRVCTVMVLFTSGMTVFCTLGAVMKVHDSLLSIAIGGNLVSAAIMLVLGLTGAYKYMSTNFIQERLEDISFPHIRIMLSRVKREGV